MPDDKTPRIKVTENGPYLVSGSVPLSVQEVVCDKEGNPIKWSAGEKYPLRERYALCRCGRSKNKPFCDSSHAD